MFYIACYFKPAVCRWQEDDHATKKKAIAAGLGVESENQQEEEVRSFVSCSCESSGVQNQLTASAANILVKPLFFCQNINFFASQAIISLQKGKSLLFLFSPFLPFITVNKVRQDILSLIMPVCYK